MKPQFAECLPPNWEKFACFFSALGDSYRQKILLTFDPGEEICVNDIARLFKLSRPAISHHLKVLKDAGLVVCEKRGKEVYYRINYEYCAGVIEHVRDFITKSTPSPQSTMAIANSADYSIAGDVSLQAK
ncbi:ArsR/SmtB family transcription factor [Pseudomonadota bacterium]